MNAKKLNKKGAVTLILLVSLSALLGMGALVIDGGALYYEKMRLQSAVDAAALAGATALAQDQAGVYDTTLQIALANGLSPSDVGIVVDVTGRTVTVTGKRLVTFGLARILNFTEAELRATASAGAFWVSGVQGAVPLGVICQNFEYGRSYTLKEGGGGGTTGNYGAFALGGRGAETFRQNLCNGYRDWLRVGDWIVTEPGAMTGDTAYGVSYRIAQCTDGCTYDHHEAGCPRVVKLPIVSALPNGRGEVNILGIACFFLEGMEADGGISGRFIETVVSGEISPVRQPYGLQTVKLLR